MDTSHKGNGDNREAIKEAFQQCRAQTALLAAPLKPEDQTIQTMPEASPTKWHLAHTSWFFETFVLKPFLPTYRELNPHYSHLFNSYYEQIGNMWVRAERGLLSRPSVAEVMDYRASINEQIAQLIEQANKKTWEEVKPLVVLGIHHEWQHQELLLTDIKHALAYNPLRPAAYERGEEVARKNTEDPLTYLSFAGGLHPCGHMTSSADAFCFDNETPQHERLVRDFALGERLITNGEYLEFIHDGGYEQVALWLADGWTEKNTAGWTAPLYWHRDENRGWCEYTLFGDIPLDSTRPVTHISFYEAMAFANWANKRLPYEEELELASNGVPITGNLGKMIENNKAVGVHPQAAASPSPSGLRQIYGDGWEWTQSPYTPYPKYKPARTALGEYNGKFMCNQFVLKGGSCATPENQIRASYRNFFPPSARWQFSALRLAEDC